MTGNAWVASAAMARGIRIGRLRLHASGEVVDVDLRGTGDTPRPLSTVVDPLGPGGPSVVDILAYGLGTVDRLPGEVPVRLVCVEADLSGEPYVLERAVGASAGFVSVRAGRIGERGASAERRRVRPARDPESLSSLLLAHCKLAGGGADTLKFRNLMWLCVQRGGDDDLLFEEQPLKNLRLRQVFDIVFDVHDDQLVELRRSAKEVQSRVRTARAVSRAAEELVREQGLGQDPDELQRTLAATEADLAGISRSLGELDARATAATGFAADLRTRLRNATENARDAAAALWDTEAEVQQLVPLRAQYADDTSRLVLLAEARTIFDPLPVLACPLCLRELDRTATAAHAERCPLCQRNHRPTATDPTPDYTGELRAVRSRLSELDGHLDDLDAALPHLRDAAARAHEDEARAAHELDAATTMVLAPFVAERDLLLRRRERAAVTLERARIGLGLVRGVEDRSADLARRESELAALRTELVAALRRRSGDHRSIIVRQIGERFRDILISWRYPGLGDAHIDGDLTPFVLGHPYRDEPRRARGMIGLAWLLAVFETAWESGTSHPGFLLLDHPSSLGPPTPELRRHLTVWLSGRGAGAQVIVADRGE